ncbi:MAG: hypothetical protein WBG01_02155 [Bacteroidota bacterium]
MGILLAQQEGGIPIRGKEFAGVKKITFWNTMGKIRDSENAPERAIVSTTGAHPTTRHPYAAATSNRKINGTASATTTARILMT